MLEESSEVALVDMEWEKHWAEIRVLDQGFTIDALRARLMAAGAWCAPWPEGVQA